MSCFYVLGQGIGTDCKKSEEELNQAIRDALKNKKEPVAPKEWTPLQIFGVVGGSLLAITLMTVILIKAKKAK